MLYTTQRVGDFTGDWTAAAALQVRIVCTTMESVLVARWLWVLMGEGGGQSLCKISEQLVALRWLLPLSFAYSP